MHPAQSGDRCQIEQANFVRQVIVDVFGDPLEAPFLQGADLPSTLVCLAGPGDLVFRLQAGEPDRDGKSQRFCATSVAFQFKGMQSFGKRIDDMVNALTRNRARRNVRPCWISYILDGLIENCSGGRVELVVVVIEK